MQPDYLDKISQPAVSRPSTGQTHARTQTTSLFNLVHRSIKTDLPRRRQCDRIRRLQFRSTCLYGDQQPNKGSFGLEGLYWPCHNVVRKKKDGHVSMLPWQNRDGCLACWQSDMSGKVTRLPMYICNTGICSSLLSIREY